MELEVGTWLLVVGHIQYDLLPSFFLGQYDKTMAPRIDQIGSQ